MQENGSWNLAYEIIMVILAVVVAVNLYLSFFVNLTADQSVLVNRIDIFLLSIFVVDYLVRLYKTDNKIQFIKLNWIDLVAIMPFDMAFRAFRLARLTRIVRVLRLIRAGVMLKRFFHVPLEILNTNHLGKVLFSTVIMVILGAIGIFISEEKVNNIGDALWWAIVTTTTVGYGDISPSSTAGRIIAIVLMLIGIGTIGMLTGSIATYFISDKKNNDDVLDLIHKKINNLENLNEVEFNELIRLINEKRLR